MLGVGIIRIKAHVHYLFVLVLLAKFIFAVPVVSSWVLNVVIHACRQCHVLVTFYWHATKPPSINAYVPTNSPLHISIPH
ncbi:hypothetical protein F5Y15DRAFT_31817 [Xylariaceae sp. FL0016]|nr:hypothetical protein F5Y15DRAFT_31817 [Xylariaceae sp. FL0016]